MSSNDNNGNNINLHYIRAAIEANTGIRLDLKTVRRYLVEEGLVTRAQAKRHAQIFTGYNDFYEDYTGFGVVKRPEEPEELTGLFQ